MDHNLDGSTITVTTYTAADRLTPTVDVSAQEIPNEDPYLFTLPTLTDYQWLELLITVSGAGTASVGEIGLYEKFTSPVGPGIGIRTVEIPRRTFVLLPNGERQSIKHGGVIRQKNYTIGGLSIDEANEWVAVFTNNAGAQLVILEDERGDTYPCMMQQEMTINDSTNILTIDLEFLEVKLA